MGPPGRVAILGPGRFHRAAYGGAALGCGAGAAEVCHTWKKNARVTAREICFVDGFGVPGLTLFFALAVVSKRRQPHNLCNSARPLDLHALQCREV